MKKLILTLTSILSAIIIFAQPPQAFKYQAVVRDNTGEILQNQPVGIRISIHDATAGGTIIYQETFSGTTNQFGLITLDIGLGSPVGYYNFENIDWEHYSKFLEIEIDTAGGTTYVSIGTSELMSVPYALYSEQSKDVLWNNNGNDIYYIDGDVGIGTSDPNSNLHVYGNGLFKGTNGGINIGTGTDYGSLGYSSPSGGFTNMQLYWGTTVINGNVGINTYNPGSKLEISGLSTVSGLRVRYNQTYSTVYGEFKHGQSEGLIINANAGGGGWADIRFQTNDDTKMFLESAGKLGLGTLLPDVTLHVETGTDIELDGGGHLVLGSTISSNIGMDNNEIMARNNGSVSDLHLNYEGGNVLVSGGGTGKLGIGTTTPNSRLDVEGVGTNEVISAFSNNATTAVHATSLTGTGVWGASSSGYGVFGQSSSHYAGYFSGPVHITGNLSKGTGSFVIDHPLDPENKLLRHNFVESPENLLIYRGKAELNNQGEAIVKMPDYFEALTKEDQASIHLTPVGRPFLTGAEWNSDFSAIIIYGDKNREVFWEVLANRDDPVIHELGRPVEEEKGGKNTLCEKGKLLYPKAYGYPESMGRDYETNQLIKNSHK